MAVVVLLIEALLVSIGLRLLARALRRGGGPEGQIGVFFMCMSGMILMRFAGQMPGLLPSASAQQAAILCADGFFFASAVSLAAFTRRVFRREASWARWLVVSLTLASVLCFCLQVWLGRAVTGLDLAARVLRLLPFLWAFIENATYARQIRRRCRIGLADPVVANRFLLWSIWTGSVTGLPLFGLIALVVGLVRGSGDPLTQPASFTPELVPAVLVVSAALVCLAGLIATVSLWLSFFPPRAYRRWVETPA